MNDKWSDQILDSFLDEIISGDKPPDLSHRILAQLAERQKVSPSSDIPLPEVPDDVDADRSWWQQVVHMPPVQDPNATRLNSSPSTSVSNSNANLRRLEVAIANEKRKRQRLALALGVAACILAIVSLASVLPKWYEPNSNLAQSNPPKIAPQEANAPKLANSASSTVRKDTATQPLPKEAELPRPERLDIKGLPFAVVEPDAMPNSPTTDSTPENDVAMTDADIVSEINSSFGDLWDQYKVRPTNVIDDKEWLERVATVLLNTTPSSAQIELFKQTEDPNKRNYLLQQATSSERFSRYFAKHLVSLLVPDQREATASWRQEFEIWLTQNIAQRTPYNEVVYKLLTATSSQKTDAIETNVRPEGYWLTALEDPQGHAVAQRVGSLWLNQSLHCSQCHDQGEAAETSQSAYWAIVAALNLGSKPEYFFERKDGTLQAAIAALPNGQSLDSVAPEKRRETFAKWLSTNPALAEGAVNMTWKLVFGAPLVSNEAAMDDPMSNARIKLLKTLSQQFRIHRYDLPRLVMWVSASQPFATPTRVITQRDWLLASETELRDIRNSESLFASYRRLEMVEIDSKDILQKLVRFEREEAGNSLRRTVLAQPMPTQSLPNQNPTTLSTDPLPAWQQNLRLHASSDSDAVHLQLVSRLLKTKLSWPQLVQHALGRQPSTQELRWAEELLQYHGGDKQATLLKLHWTTHQSL